MVATLTDPQLLSTSLSPPAKEHRTQNSNDHASHQNHSANNKAEVLYITPGKTNDIPEDIESFVHLLANFDPDNPDKTISSEKYLQVARPDTNESTKDSDNPKGKRRSRSNSNRLLRISSGSSSTDGGEDGTESKTSKSSVEKNENKENKETKPG